MRKTTIPLLLSVLLLSAVPALSQDQPDSMSVTVTKLTDTIYKLVCTTFFSVNVTASVGPDGILLVDAGQAPLADSLSAVLKGLGGGDAKYLINTHLHGDHTGGNRAFADQAAIIAHKNVRERWGGDYYSLPGTPSEGTPSITFDDSLTLHFNGEEIKLIHLPQGHTDGDVIVYFTGSNIVAIGDMLFSDRLPFVDVVEGGDVELFADHIKNLIDAMPDDVTFIAGHGRDYTKDDLRQHHDLLVKTMDVVRNAMESGNTLEEMIADSLLKDWEAFNWRFIDTDRWTQILYTSLSNRIQPPAPSICEPLTATIVENGIEAAISQYRDLKENQPDAYNFQEAELNMLGYQLLQRDMAEEAIEIFKLNVETFPYAFNPYDSLGEAYMIHGDKEQAIVNFQKSLELNPDNTNAEDKLKELRGS